MTATTFRITALENGRELGGAVICVGARYCSILWRAADRPDRRFVAPSVWKALETADTLEPGPLPADHPAVAALLPPEKRQRYVVQYLYVTPVGEHPQIAQDLDALLMATSPPRLGLEALS